jgi:hypothetical protein
MFSQPVTAAIFSNEESLGASIVCQASAVSGLYWAASQQLPDWILQYAKRGSRVDRDRTLTDS